MTRQPPGFWSVPVADLLRQLRSTPDGLPGKDARQRLARYGANLLKPGKTSDPLALSLSRFRSPIILILLFATGMSFFLHDPVDAAIVLAIALASGLLGFWQERGAASAVEKLLAIVQLKATAIRDNTPAEIRVEEIVPGDVVVLNAGVVIPGDCLILDSRDFAPRQGNRSRHDVPGIIAETIGLRKGLGVSTKIITGDNSTGWFLESVVSASLIVLVVVATPALPFTPVARLFDFRPLAISFVILLGGIVALYIIATEITKKLFFGPA